MEGGVAFLHTRAKDKGKIARPFIVVGRSWEGIPFGAPDGNPTYLFFLLGLKYDRLHLPILGRLARALRNPATIAKLRSLSVARPGPRAAAQGGRRRSARASCRRSRRAAFKPKLDRTLRLRAIRRLQTAKDKPSPSPRRPAARRPSGGQGQAAKCRAAGHRRRRPADADRTRSPGRGCYRSLDRCGPYCAVSRSGAVPAGARGGPARVRRAAAARCPTAGRAGITLDGVVGDARTRWLRRARGSTRAAAPVRAHARARARRRARRRDHAARSRRGRAERRARARGAGRGRDRRRARVGGARRLAARRRPARGAARSPISRASRASRRRSSRC